MNNENGWALFEKSMDEKYLSVNRVHQKKKRWIIGLIFCAIIGILFSVDMALSSTYERVKERKMISLFESWKKSGKPLGEELAQLVKSRNWDQYVTITNASFILEQNTIEALFVTFWPRSGKSLFNKSLFLCKDGTLIWVNTHSGKVLEIKHYNASRNQGVKDVEALH